MFSRVRINIYVYGKLNYSGMKIIDNKKSVFLFYAVFSVLCFWSIQHYWVAIFWDNAPRLVSEKYILAGDLHKAVLKYHGRVRPVFDDAYMFMRYADNILAGSGVSWNSSDGYAYGCTSLAYLFSIVMVRYLFSGASIEEILVGTSFFYGIAAIALLAYIVKTLFIKKRFLGWIIAFGLLITYLTHFTELIFFTRSGMDTTISFYSNSLLCAVLLKFLVSKHFRLIILLSFVAYFSFLSRPDNFIYSTMIVPFVLFTSGGVKNENWNNILVFFLLFGLLLVIDTLIKYLMFGDPLPISYYAKSLNYYEGYVGYHRWNAGLYFRTFLIWSFPFFLIIIFYARKTDWRLLCAIIFPIFLTLTNYLFVVQIMGYRARYYFPSLPFIILMASLLLCKRWMDGLNSSFWVGKVVVSVFFLVTLFESNSKDMFRYISEEFLMPKEVRYTPETEWKTSDKYSIMHRYRWMDVSKLFTKFPSGVSMSASEYGYIAANCPHIYILDVLGLHDVDFAKQGFSMELLFDKSPDLIWLPHSDYTWMLQQILDSDRFWQEYDYYPYLCIYGLAIKKRGAFYQQINLVLSEELKQLYNIDELNDIRAVRTESSHDLQLM